MKLATTYLPPDKTSPPPLHAVHHAICVACGATLARVPRAGSAAVLAHTRGRWRRCSRALRRAGDTAAAAGAAAGGSPPAVLASRLIWSAPHSMRSLRCAPPPPPPRTARRRRRARGRRSGGGGGGGGSQRSERLLQLVLRWLLAESGGCAKRESAQATSAAPSPPSTLCRPRPPRRRRRRTPRGPAPARGAAVRCRALVLLEVSTPTAPPPAGKDGESKGEEAPSDEELRKVFRGRCSARCPRRATCPRG